MPNMIGTMPPITIGTRAASPIHRRFTFMTTAPSNRHAPARNLSMIFLFFILYASSLLFFHNTMLYIHRIMLDIYNICRAVLQGGNTAVFLPNILWGFIPLHELSSQTGVRSIEKEQKGTRLFGRDYAPFPSCTPRNRLWAPPGTRPAYRPSDVHTIINSIIISFESNGYYSFWSPGISLRVYMGHWHSPGFVRRARGVLQAHESESDYQADYADYAG